MHDLQKNKNLLSLKIKEFIKRLQIFDESYDEQFVDKQQLTEEECQTEYEAWQLAISGTNTLQGMANTLDGLIQTSIAIQDQLAENYWNCRSP